MYIFSVIIISRNFPLLEKSLIGKTDILIRKSLRKYEGDGFISTMKISLNEEESHS